MKLPRVKFIDPSDVHLRRWVIGLAAPRIHGEAAQRLRKHAVADMMESGRVKLLLPPRPPGSTAALSFPQFLELLERLTITEPEPPAVRASTRRVRVGALTVDCAARRGALALRPQEYVAIEANLAFAERWREWFWQPMDRDAAFVHEYEFVRDELVKLHRADRPLRGVLQEMVGEDGVLLLASWSCTVPKRWKARATWQESASDWAETLLAFKYGSNTRAVKERLARAHEEERIAAAWRAYGEWLRPHPEMLRDLAPLLAVISVTDPFLVGASRPLHLGHSESAHK